ncbi:MAG TPA: hypothetical protein VFM07_12170, partial [Intrasporangium sp.]|nr:hypothetical protein [Intrasporangium sp.]
MTDHPRNEPRQPSLDDFFARERAEAPVLQPDESRWQRIVAEARTHQVPWGRYLLGAAAVVVLAAALGWGLLRTGPGPGPGLPAPASSTPATGSTTQPTPPPTSGSSSSR